MFVLIDRDEDLVQSATALAAEYLGVGLDWRITVFGRAQTPQIAGQLASKAYLDNRSARSETLVLYRRANRQYVAMSSAEVWKFVRSKHRLFIGFSMDGGYPHVTPIWFVLVGERIYMRAQDYKVKVGLAARGKACLVVDDGEKYRELRGVVMWGKTSIVDDPKLASKLDRLFAGKYSRLQWRADEMPAGWVASRAAERRVHIEFVPEKVASWDNRKV